MKVRIIKGGKWALGGTTLVELGIGMVDDFGDADGFALVNAGWAKFADVETVAEVSEPIHKIPDEGLSFDEFAKSAIAEEGKRGWWTVLYGEGEYKVRAKDEAEALRDAYAKLNS